MKEPGTEIIDSSWKGLFKISGVAAVVMMVFFLFDTVMWAVLGPYPDSAEGWFTLLQTNRLVGFSLLSFPTLFGMLIYYLIFLGLYLILKRVNMAYATLAALFAFVGITILLVTNMAYPLVHLSDQYIVAKAEAQKVLFLSAGEARIAVTRYGSNFGGLLAEGAAFIFSLLMLRSDVFGKTTAYLGIVGHGLDLIRIMLVLAFLPEEIAAVLLMIGGLPQFIWLILVGRKFFQLGQVEPERLV